MILEYSPLSYDTIKGIRMQNWSDAVVGADHSYVPYHALAVAGEYIKKIDQL